MELLAAEVDLRVPLARLLEQRHPAEAARLAAVAAGLGAEGRDEVLLGHLLEGLDLGLQAVEREEGCGRVSCGVVAEGEGCPRACCGEGDPKGKETGRTGWTGLRGDDGYA